MSKILLIGRTGQLGSALLKDAAILGYEVIAPDRHEFDIRDQVAFKGLMEHYRPKIIINTAAFNNLLLCETEVSNAFQVNCFAVAKMAEICYKFGALFVSFSTDYVFNGKKKKPYIESDTPGPLQIYGLSKLAGEYAALSYDTSVIIRTCGLYGGHGSSVKGNCVNNRIEDSKHGPLEVSNDLTASPTFAEDLSKAVLRLIEHTQAEPGLYHLTNEGYCTWYEFTREIFRIKGIDTLVIPVYGSTAALRRPLFTALKNEKANRLKIVLPHWKDALRRFSS